MPFVVDKKPQKTVLGNLARPPPLPLESRQFNEGVELQQKRAVQQHKCNLDIHAAESFCRAGVEKDYGRDEWCVQSSSV